jgi:hypothetical protein
MSTTTSPEMDKKTSDGTHWEPWEAWEAWQTSLTNETFTNLRRFASIPFLPEKLERVRKGVTPREVVYEEDRLKVYRYLGEGKPRFKTPLCLVFALVNRPYIMDLKEGLSIIAHYVNAGFESYLIDWGTPTRAESFLTTDDYVNGYLLNVCQISPGKDWLRSGESSRLLHGWHVEHHVYRGPPGPGEEPCPACQRH